MNCLEFRRLVTIDPRSRDREALEHRHQCASCEAMYQRTLATEQILERSVNVGVPNDLGRNILARHSGDHANRARTWKRISLNAIAASLILAAGIGLGMKFSAPASSALPHYVLQHVYDELPMLTSSQAMGPASLQKTLQDEHLKVNHIENLKYAGACAFRNGRSVHMIVQGEVGPVTVLLLPEENINKRLPISDQRFTGSISPAPRGSLAVIGEKREPIEKIEHEIRQQVQWL